MITRANGSYTRPRRDKVARERKPLPVWRNAAEFQPPPREPPPAAIAQGPLTSLAPRVLRLVLGLDAHGVRRLVLASIVPAAAACGDSGSMRMDARAPDASDAASAEGGTGTIDAATNSPFPPRRDAGHDADHDPRVDPDYPFGVPPPEPVGSGCVETAFAELPPEGVPATVEQLCARPGQDVVESGWAARVTLVFDAFDRATGRVDLAPELIGHVVGIPELTATGGDLPSVAFADIAADGDGFSFTASWQEFIDTNVPFVEIVVRVLFQVDCDVGPNTGPARDVESRHSLYLCNDGGAFHWISAGENCRACAIIAEMAPSPIVPMPRASELPLGGVMRLAIRVMTRVGGDLVLLAEHDRGANAEYAWSATAGHIEQVDGDVVIWRVPRGAPGPHMIQVAAETADAAGVASLRWEGARP